MKRILTLALIALAVGGAIKVIKNPVGTAPPIGEAPGSFDARSFPSPSDLPADGVVVTYFTTDVRCPSCLRIEDLARKSVESNFGNRLEPGVVIFRTINTDRAENRHFVDDYRPVSKTVIVSERQGGREAQWVNLQDVWLKLNNEAEFDAYVSDAIRKILGDQS